jgi:hypothetical protein
MSCGHGSGYDAIKTALLCALRVRLGVLLEDPASRRAMVCGSWCAPIHSATMTGDVVAGKRVRRTGFLEQPGLALTAFLI